MPVNLKVPVESDLHAVAREDGRPAALRQLIGVQRAIRIREDDAIAREARVPADMRRDEGASEDLFISECDDVRDAAELCHLPRGLEAARALLRVIDREPEAARRALEA